MTDVSRLGMGAMLDMLSGGSKHSSSEFEGKGIRAASFDGDRLRLSFDDGTAIDISDKAQSCCESRYITTDDDVSSLVGGVLRGIFVKEGPDIEERYGSHETAFVEVATYTGSITLCTHNEHNGYYGGFGLAIDVVTT